MPGLLDFSQRPHGLLAELQSQGLLGDIVRRMLSENLVPSPMGTPDHSSQWPATGHAGNPGRVDPLEFAMAIAGGPKLNRLGGASLSELLGLHPTTTAKRIADETRKGGGYSVHLPTGERPKEGLMVGKYANDDPRNLVVPSEKFSAKDVRKHAETNRAQLAREDTFLGTWHDADSGRTYLDVSKRFPSTDIRQATKYGERTGQLAGYNVGVGETFPIGNWNKFIESPEFHGRLTEMAGKGRAYLDQFPAKEWWDMHGSGFERAYGSQNLPQVAGFTAATAPNTAPYTNLQQMSEYMRRRINGGPTVQPDWRAPPGLMSLSEGKKMPMESSRVANLEKAARGDIDALSKDKVRNEAKAMMGDPNAVVLDRHHARLSESPSRGIFANVEEGKIAAGKDYAALQAQITAAAERAGRSPRDYSADVWTGIREQLKTGDLYGTKYRGSAIQGDSKSYADIFEDVLRDKAKFLGITVKELEQKLRSGDANLLSVMLSAPVVAEMARRSAVGEQPAPRGLLDF